MRWLWALGLLWCVGCRCQTDAPVATPATGANPAVAAASDPVQGATVAPIAEAATPAEPAQPARPDVTCPAGTKKDVGDTGVRCLRNGQPDGPEVIWNPETGKPQAELQWKAGKKSGPARYYYPNGKLRIEVSYVDDKEEGLHRQYANERVINEGEMRKGKPEGKWTWYRPNDGGLDRVECQHEGAVVWVERSQAAADGKKCP